MALFLTDSCFWKVAFRNRIYQVSYSRERIHVSPLISVHHQLKSILVLNTCVFWQTYLFLANAVDWRYKRVHMLYKCVRIYTNIYK